MANKFVLVPHAMYQSLLGKTTDDSVDAARLALDRTLTDPSTSVAEKNALYNKRLFDLKLRRFEAMDKPVKVELTNPLTATWEEGPPDAAGVNLPPDDGAKTPPTITPRRVRRKKTDGPLQELMDLINRRRADFGVDQNGRILTADDQPIARSDFARALRHLVEKKERREPAGTSELKNRIATNSATRRFLYPDPPSTSQWGFGEKRFRPKLWKS